MKNVYLATAENKSQDLGVINNIGTPDSGNNKLKSIESVSCSSSTVMRKVTSQVKLPEYFENNDNDEASLIISASLDNLEWKEGGGILQGMTHEVDKSSVYIPCAKEAISNAILVLAQCWTHNNLDVKATTDKRANDRRALSRYFTATGKYGPPPPTGMAKNVKENNKHALKDKYQASRKEHEINNTSIEIIDNKLKSIPDILGFLKEIDKTLTFPAGEAAPILTQSVVSPSRGITSRLTQEDLNLMESMKFVPLPGQVNYHEKNDNPAIYGDGEITTFITVNGNSLQVVNIAGIYLPLTTQVVPGHWSRLGVADNKGRVHPLGWSADQGWYFDKDRTYSQVDHIIAENDAVIRGLQERGKLNSGIDITRERLLGTVCRVLELKNNTQEEINVARDILSATGSYGGEKSDTLSLNAAKEVVRQWLINNILDDTLAVYIYKLYIENPDMTIGQLSDMLSLGNISMGIDVNKIPHASQASFNIKVESIIRDELPILSLLEKDPQLKSVPVTDYEFASLYAGAKWLGYDDVKSFNREEIAKIGESIWDLNPDNGVDIYLLPYFELSALLQTSARVTPTGSMINTLNATIDLAEDRKNIEELQLEILKCYDEFKESARKWTRKGRLADNIMDSCPNILKKVGERGRDHTQGWHNLHERYMEGAEKPCDEAPDSLDDEYARMTRKVADDFKPLERVLLNISIEKEKTEDVNYINSTETTIYPVKFRLRGYSSNGGRYPDYKDKDIKLNRTHLFATKQNGVERIYALKSVNDDTIGEFKLIRLSRDVNDYIRTGVLDADFSNGYNVSDSGRVLTANGTQYTLDVMADTKQTIGKGIPLLVEYVVNKNSEALYNMLYKSGNEKTFSQIIGGEALNLLPLYKCITGLKEADYDEAIESCLMDIISIAPILGQAGKLSGKFAKGLSKGLREGSVALRQNKGVLTAGRALLGEVRLPKGSELINLGKETLSTLEPGLLSAGKGTGQSLVWLGEKIAKRLKRLKWTELSNKVVDITKSVGASKQIGESKIFRLMDSDVYLPVVKTGAEGGRDIYHVINPHTGEPFGKKYKIYAGELVLTNYSPPKVGGGNIGKSVPEELKGHVGAVKEYIKNKLESGCAISTSSRTKRCIPLELPQALKNLPAEMIEKVLSYLDLNEISVLAMGNGNIGAEALHAMNKQLKKYGTEVLFKYAVEHDSAAIMKFFNFKLKTEGMLSIDTNHLSLATCITGGSANVVREILSSSVGLQQLNSHGVDLYYSPLLLAKRAGRDDIMSIILDAYESEDVGYTFWTRTRQDDLLFQVAMGFSNEIVDRVFNLPGINFNRVDGMGYTPLIMATDHNAVYMVSKLLSVAGVNVNARNSHGLNAFMTAAMRGNGEIITALSNVNGIDVNAQTYLLGETAFKLAVDHHYHDVIRILSNINEVDVNIPDTFGYTPLMSAVYRNDIPLVQQLVKIPGINLNARSAQGETAYQIAQRLGYHQVKSLFECNKCGIS